MVASFSSRFFGTWVAASLFAFAPPFAPPAVSDCSPGGGVHINEVRFLDQPAPVFGRLPATVELLNKDLSGVDVTGWTIRDLAGNVEFTFPGILLPPGAFLIVMFGEGVSDSAFVDGVRNLYTGVEELDVFDHSEGAAALYDDSGAIVDFVQWSVSGAAAPGVAADDAVAEGIWLPADYVLVDPFELLFTIRRLPDGADNDASSDWVTLPWGESNYGGVVPGPNPIQTAPRDGSGFEDGVPVTLSWEAAPGATGYHLVVVDTNSVVEIDHATTSLDTTVTLPGGDHSWTVGIVDGCGEAAGVAYEFTVFEADSVSGPGVLLSSADPPCNAPNCVRLGVERSTQHKDTAMLCIWDEVRDRWPGCTEAAGTAGPWDAAHPGDHAQTGRRQFCPHCAMYCARATVQMINHFYTGTLSQDRIAVQYAAAGDPRASSPEGDLGHGLGAGFSAGNNRPNTIRVVLDWALDNATVSTERRAICGVGWPPCGLNDLPVLGFAQLKAEIDAGRPVFIATLAHAMLIDGYRLGRRNKVHVVDPWSGQKSSQGWQDAVNFGFGKAVAWWWAIVPTGGNITGIMEDATVGMDTDSDGVVDFDEGYSAGGNSFPDTRPRRFHADFQKADTDGDGIGDKLEIRSYTFHSVDHKNHNPGPHADIDGVRPPADIDSDNDTDADSGEDLGRNGVFDLFVPGETDVFNPNSRNKKINVLGGGGSAPAVSGDEGPVREASAAASDSILIPGESALLSGETFPALETFPYRVYEGCPIPLSPPMSYLSGPTPIAEGVVASDIDGILTEVDLGTFPVGCYSVALDVFGDLAYGNLSENPEDPEGPPVVEFVEAVTEFAVEEPVPVETATLFATTLHGDVRLQWTVPERFRPARGRVERAVSETGPWIEVGSMDLLGGETRTWIDDTLDEPGELVYRVVVEGGSDAYEIGPARITVPELPLRIGLLENPVRDHARLTLLIPRTSPVVVRIYDVAGRLVRELLDGSLGMGLEEVAWDGLDQRGLPARSGVYHVRITGAGASHVARLVLLR